MSGRVIGAEGAIGGTYGVMPELYLKLDEYVRAGKMEEAREIQYAYRLDFPGRDRRVESK